MDFGLQLVRMAVSLLLVVALLMAVVYGLKRFAHWTKRPAANSQIQVLSQHAVGFKHYLLLVKVRNQSFLLGVSPQGIHLLSSVHEASDPLDFPDESRDESQTVVA